VILSSLLTHKRPYFFALSLILLMISISGPPSVKIYGIITSLDINKLIDVYTTSETLFRMPDTYLRLLVFSLAILLLIVIPFIKNETIYKIFWLYCYFLPLHIIMFFILIASLKNMRLSLYHHIS